jgi:hypothetical protein
MIRETHRIALHATGMLIAAITLRANEDADSTDLRLGSAVAEVCEDLTIDEWYDVALLDADDEIPEGWHVVYRGTSMGYLPHQADIAIARSL